MAQVEIKVATEDDEVVVSEEAIRVLDWRQERLLIGGFPIDAAIRLAKTRGVDVHQAVWMVAHGCPWHVAEQILH
jgi:hypothetical protein